MITLAPASNCCQNPGMAQPDSPLLVVLYYLAYLSVLIRMLLNGGDTGVMEPPAYALMGFFLVLSVAQPPLGRRWPATRHVTLGLQTILVIALLLTTPHMDFYAMLFVAMSIFAVHDLPDRAGLVWVGVFCLCTVLGLVAAFGGKAPGFFSSYIAGCLLIALYGRAMRNAEVARARSDALLVELGQANRRLHAYAERAEEAAAAQERAHLARELHDAATQTVFSMNLTAEAARIALKKEPKKAAAHIDTLQDLAREALAEMRTLVRELRPGSVVEEGLVKSLEKLAALRRKRDGLTVTLTVRGQEEGSIDLKETMFRTAREALNNIAKHAGVKEARLDLSFGEKDVALFVQDSGQGVRSRCDRPARELRADCNERAGRGAWRNAGGAFCGGRWYGDRGAYSASESRSRGGAVMARKPTRVRVMIVDDHAVVREGLKKYLGALGEFEIVAEAANGAEALAAAAAARPQVVLMDLVMPVMDGIEATRRLRETLPECGVIILTSFTDDDKLFPALRAGAVAYVLKDVGPAELAETIHAAARGETRLNPEVARRLVAGIAGGAEKRPEELLTEREMDVLRCLARGRSNKEIGVDLSISEKTVKTHVGNILDKLGLADRTQAALYAVKRGVG